jgi:serine phosphatase RsbU (regulator of sigma subunit)
MMRPSPSDRARALFDTYTRDMSSEDLQRLFTHDTRDAYNFFRRGSDDDRYAHLPWWKQIPLRFRDLFFAFTMRLSPARRALYLGALIVALVGVLRLFQGLERVNVPFGMPFMRVQLPLPIWADGTFALLVSFLLLNLLMLLEVADRLSLKGELEVAREIQLAMLPGGTYSAYDIEVSGATRPANTVGGDFYDVLPLPDGRVILALGDVAGKGSPAALLMALLLAVLRTLVEERLEPAELVRRLNIQICRHCPSSRFITLFYAVYEPATGNLAYVNAGQNPPLLRRDSGTYERLSSTGVALGMFETSTFGEAQTALETGDQLVLYSDGITEAEDPDGQPLEEAGLELVIERHATSSASQLATRILEAVEAHARQPRFGDDLTILILKRRRASTSFSAA